MVIKSTSRGGKPRDPKRLRRIGQHWGFMRCESQSCTNPKFRRCRYARRSVHALLIERRKTQRTPSFSRPPTAQYSPRGQTASRVSLSNDASDRAHTLGSNRGPDQKRQRDDALPSSKIPRIPSKWKVGWLEVGPTHVRDFSSIFGDGRSRTTQNRWARGRTARYLSPGWEAERRGARRGRHAHGR